MISMNISVNLSSSDYRNDEYSPMVKTMSLRAVMFAMLIAAGIIGLNASCIHILASTKRLREHNFLVISICLSISDLLFGIFSGILSFISLLYDFGIYVPYVCYTLRSIIISTGLYSVFHTLLICVDRFLATSLNVSFANYMLRTILSKKVLLISYVTFVIFGLVFYLSTGDIYDTGTCALNENDTVRLTSRITDCILFGFIVTMSILYVVVIFRILKLQQDVQQISGRKRRSRTRRNIILLGSIVVLTAVCLLPRIFMSLSLSLKDSLTAEDYFLLNFTRIISMFKPVLDPLTYIIMLKNIRQRLEVSMCYRCRRINKRYDIECAQFRGNS